MELELIIYITLSWILLSWYGSNDYI